MMSFREVLLRESARLTALSAEQADSLVGHYELMLRWNDRLNLTRVTGIEEAVVRHYCESLLVGVRVGGLAGVGVTVADLGSGAGFPGIPVAILRPDWSVTLIEAHKRKAVFLREAARHLPNVQVSDRRAGNFSRGSFDWVISRAVRWEEVLGFELGSSVALLLGADDAKQASGVGRFTWNSVAEWPLESTARLLIGTAAGQTT